MFKNIVINKYHMLCGALYLSDGKAPSYIRTNIHGACQIVRFGKWHGAWSAMLSSIHAQMCVCVCVSLPFVLRSTYLCLPWNTSPNMIE